MNTKATAPEGVQAGGAPQTTSSQVILAGPCELTKRAQENCNDIFAQLDNIFPVTDRDTSDIITVVIDGINNLGKDFKLLAGGAISKKSAVSVARGLACQYCVPDHAALEAMLRIVSESTSAAIINAGWKHAAIGERFVFISSKILAGMDLEPEAITTENGLKSFARLKSHAKPSTWQLLDRDEDNFTPEWAVKQSFNVWLQSLNTILPGVADVKMLRALSSSARVLNADGSAVGGGNGHVWVKVKEAADAERARAAIQARALEHDLAWTKPRMSRSTGLVCGKGFATIIDPSVWTTGRLVFVGRPTCSDGLTITPQQFEHIDGKNDVLDTSKAIISALKVFRASARHGVKLRLTRESAGYRSVMNNLSLDTDIELPDGSIKTVRDLMINFTGKIRCQAPFRASSSLAAFMSLDDNGNPFVFDSGTETTHVLEKPATSRKNDHDRERLINEIESRLGTMIGEDNVEAVFDDEVLRSAWDSTFCLPTNGKFAILNRNDELIELTVKDFKEFAFRRSFGRVFRTDFLNAAILEKNLSEDEETSLREYLAELEQGPFIELIKLLKQAKSLNIEVDIFAKRGTMSVADSDATISLPHRRLVAKTDFGPLIIKQVVTDYSQHFPEFHDFLSLVLHARFATDRRHAFVWLHSPSSWGKGFLLSIFAQLGLVVEVSAAEIEKAMAGGPVGLSMTDTLRAWILFVDEFKSASSELKLLNTQISISPKNQLRCSVPLYTKLFASAESVRSLVGDGVEAQFNNRFAYLSPSTRDHKIDGRQVFKDVGKATYLGALVSYVAYYLNDGVNRLCAMGAIEASKVADDFVEAYQASRRLQTTFGNLDDAVDEMVAEIRICLAEYAKWTDAGRVMADTPDVVQGIGQQLLATIKRTAIIGYVSEGGNSKQRKKAVVLGEPVQFIKSYVALSGDRSTVGKMQYKADIIAAKLHMRQEAYSGRVRVYNAVGNHGVLLADKRGVVVFIS